ncbi:hypothetical protein PMAYCL1PPCAC_21670, partial [Pristionchus mayeri]
KSAYRKRERRRQYAVHVHLIDREVDSGLREEFTLRICADFSRDRRTCLHSGPVGVWASYDMPIRIGCTEKRGREHDRV